MLALGIALVLAAAPRPAPAPPRVPAPPAAPPLPQVVATFMHDLATPDGVVPLTWPSLSYDRRVGELFVVADGFVRIFDATGMEVHRFGDDGSLGQISRVVAIEDGQFIVLTTLDGKRAYLRCDFRGELITRFGLEGLPKGLEDFQPDQLVYKDEMLYWAERGTMRVVVTDVTGTYRYLFMLRDLIAAALPPDGDRKPAASIDGFNVDESGNVLITMSTMFSGAIVTTSGDVRLFGSRGSRPGKFNVIGGIDADEKGYVYVTDRLRSVVSVWDKDLRHLADFGYRGDGAGNLLTPYEIQVGNGRVFVAQAGKKGVKVFRVKIVEPDPNAPKVPPDLPDPPPPPQPPPSSQPTPRGRISTASTLSVESSS
jgi:hypothetical protein